MSNHNQNPSLLSFFLFLLVCRVCKRFRKETSYAYKWLICKTESVFSCWTKIRACAARDEAICFKNSKIVPYHRDSPNTRNSSPLPYHLLICRERIMGPRHMQLGCQASCQVEMADKHSHSTDSSVSGDEFSQD